MISWVEKMGVHKPGRLSGRLSGLVNSPLTSRLRDQLGKIPQAAAREDLAGGGIAFGGPFRGEAHGGGLGSLALGDVDDALFGEALVGVLQGFFVDGFEVGEVALVVEGFAELYGK